MGYTAPPTWAVGDPLTAAQMNTYLRDNMIDLDARKGVYARCNNSSGLSISSGSLTAFASLDTEEQDPFGFHSGSNGYLTVPAGKAGFYIVGATGYWSYHADGYRSIGLRVNGADRDRQTTDAFNDGVTTDMQVTGAFYLNEGDTVTASVIQTSLTTLTFSGATLWLLSVGG
jgi:hypothetical protein